MIPSPLWLVLFFTSGLIFVYMLFFADSGERAVTQALMMGTVVAVVVSTLLLLQFLNNPFHDGIGGLRPDRDGTDVEGHRPGAHARRERDGAPVRRPRQRPVGLPR